MPMNTRHRQLYGHACIDPEGPVEAGSTGTFTLTYTVGQYGIDDGGTLKIAVRFASDWGYPQLSDPQAPNYTIVRSSGAGPIRARFDVKGYIRPYQKCLVIDVEEWALAPGETLQVVYGDRSQGSPGTQVQTFCESRFCFKVAVDCFGTGQFVELAEPPVLEVVPGLAAKLVALGPSAVAVGEPFAVGVRAEDRWGNPAVGYDGQVRFEHGGAYEGLPSAYRFTPEDGGVCRLQGVRCTQPGIHRLTVRGDEGLEATANPLRCRAEAEDLQPLWGDLHGQSEETVGTNSIEAYFRFARDAAMLDFAGHQGNDFQITPEFWRRINRCAAAFDAPGSFVVFPGYEWSATTPAGGDRNVYFLAEGEPIRRTSHWQVAARGDAEHDCYPADRLFAALDPQKALVVPHIGGRPANLAFHDPDLEPVIEIYSAWGQFEWLLQEAFERGYKVGIVAGSDDHKGRPGASYPGSSSFGVYGGLTCVLAEEWSRAGIWAALKQRRCYGTSGQRILLDVRADGHRMGTEFAASGPVRFCLEAAATAPIEEIRLMRGTEAVRVYPAEMPRHTARLRVVWEGARIKGRARIACWDGELRLAGGRITAVEAYAFDSAAEGIEAWDAHSVRWKSVTSGDEDGLILDVEAGPDARLDFSSELASLSCRLDELTAGPVCLAAGGVGLGVRVEYLPLGLGTDHCRLEWSEEIPSGTAIPYYIRLTQVDGGRAWSSPFYISAK